MGLVTELKPWQHARSIACLLADVCGCGSRGREGRYRFAGAAGYSRSQWHPRIHGAARTSTCCRRARQTGARVPRALQLDDELCSGRCGVLERIQLCVAGCAKSRQYARPEPDILGAADGAGSCRSCRFDRCTWRGWSCRSARTNRTSRRTRRPVTASHRGACGCSRRSRCCRAAGAARASWCAGRYRSHRSELQGRV